MVLSNKTLHDYIHKYFKIYKKIPKIRCTANQKLAFFNKKYKMKIYFLLYKQISWICFDTKWKKILKNFVMGYNYIVKLILNFF